MEKGSKTGSFFILLIFLSLKKHIIIRVCDHSLAEQDFHVFPIKTGVIFVYKTKKNMKIKGTVPVGNSVDSTKYEVYKTLNSDYSTKELVAISMADHVRVKELIDGQKNIPETERVDGVVLHDDPITGKYEMDMRHKKTFKVLDLERTYMMPI
jgi:hypothetical protein